MEPKIKLSLYGSLRAPKQRDRRNLAAKRAAVLRANQRNAPRILFGGEAIGHEEATHVSIAIDDAVPAGIPDILSLPVFSGEIAVENAENIFPRSGGAPSGTLGGLLRARREALGMSIADVAHAIHTASDYIRAIEHSDWRVFPARVYAEGFFKKMLAELAIGEQDALQSIFASEWDRARVASCSPFLEHSPRRTVLVITPRYIVLMGVGILAAGIIGFLGFRLVRFTGAPGLVLREPSEQAIFKSPVARIVGSVDGESQMTVNGHEVKVDERGNFDEELAVRPGVNTLEFRVVNRLKKETIVTQHVIVQ